MIFERVEIVGFRGQLTVVDAEQNNADWGERPGKIQPADALTCYCRRNRSTILSVRISGSRLGDIKAIASITCILSDFSRNAAVAASGTSLSSAGSMLGRLGEDDFTVFLSARGRMRYDGSVMTLRFQ